MYGGGSADRIEAGDPEAWIQGAIARRFGDHWESRPRGVPREVEDAWRLGVLHAPAIDLDTESLIELQFPIDSWGTPQDGFIGVRQSCRGVTTNVVPCATRRDAVSVASHLALGLGVSSVRVREQKGDGVGAGGQIYYIVAIEELPVAVCRVGMSWESAATRAYWERGCEG